MQLDKILQLKIMQTFKWSLKQQDESFLTAQFLLYVFSASYRIYRNLKGGRILLYIMQDIPSRLFNSKSKTVTETISVEVNSSKRKCFLNCFYNPNKNRILNHLECLNRVMDMFSKTYNKIKHLYKRQCNDVLLFFELCNKFDRSTNMLQKS